MGRRTDRGNVAGFLGSVKSLLSDHKFKEKSVIVVRFILWPRTSSDRVGEGFHLTKIIA